MSEEQDRPLTRRELRERERLQSANSDDATGDAPNEPSAVEAEPPARLPEPPTGAIPLIGPDGLPRSRREMRELWAQEQASLEAGTEGSEEPPAQSDSHLLDTQAMSFDELAGVRSNDEDDANGSADAAADAARAARLDGDEDEDDADDEIESPHTPVSAGRERSGFSFPWGRNKQRAAEETEESETEAAAVEDVVEVPAETVEEAASVEIPVEQEPAGEISFDELLTDSGEGLEEDSNPTADGLSVQEAPEVGAEDETEAEAVADVHAEDVSVEDAADEDLAEPETVLAEAEAEAEPEAEAEAEAVAVAGTDLAEDDDSADTDSVAVTVAEVVDDETEPVEAVEIVVEEEAPALAEYSFPDIAPLEEERSVFDDPSTTTLTSIPDPLTQQTGVDTSADFDDLISHAVAAEVSGSNTGALILPAMPDTGDLTGALNDTGEIYITGSIELPKSLGETGGHARLFDTVETSDDHFAEDLGASTDDATDGTAPVSATRAISAQASNNAIVTPATTKGNKLPLILSISGGGLLLAVIGLFIWGASNGMFG